MGHIKGEINNLQTTLHAILSEWDNWGPERESNMSQATVFVGGGGQVWGPGSFHFKGTAASPSSLLEAELSGAEVLTPQMPKPCHMHCSYRSAGKVNHSHLSLSISYVLQCWRLSMGHFRLSSQQHTEVGSFVYFTGDEAETQGS